MESIKVNSVEPIRVLFNYIDIRNDTISNQKSVAYVAHSAIFRSPL